MAENHHSWPQSANFENGTLSALGWFLFRIDYKGFIRVSALGFGTAVAMIQVGKFLDEALYEWVPWFEVVYEK